jgi:hypothetical protein
LLSVIHREREQEAVLPFFFVRSGACSARFYSVSTLAEIEAAADALPLEQKKKLLQFLLLRVNGQAEARRPTDLAEFSGVLRLSEDPLAWQQRMRTEWNDRPARH